MVGVPWSKACITCLKRKKGCDERRPGCARCEKSGLECAGYARERVFVNMHRVLTNRTPPTTIALPDTLSRSAYESGYLGGFWTAYLPKGCSLSSDTVLDTIGTWPGTIQVLYSTDDTLRKAVLALCLASSGRKEDLNWKKEEGLRLYVSALREMETSLKKRSRTKRDSILITARVFSLYEAMCGADELDRPFQATSWIAHISGEVAILNARGPDQFTEGHAHSYFIFGRLHLTILAIRMRKKSFLSNLEWKTIPWKYHAKTQKDRLLDILVDIPTLMEEFDLFRSCSNKSPELISSRQRLIDHCWLCDQRLNHWYANLTLYRFSKPLGKGEPFIIEDVDLGSVHLMTLYWSTCVILYNILHEAIDRNSQLPERTDLKAYCRNIVKAMPVFFHPAVGTLRAYLASFPLYVVMMHLHTFDPEDREAEEMLLEDCFDRPEGIGIGKFLKSVELEASKHSLRP